MTSLHIGRSLSKVASSSLFIALCVYTYLHLPLEPLKTPWRDRLQQGLDLKGEGQWYYDRTGELLRVIPHHDHPYSFPVSIDQVTNSLIDSVICLEDQTYYTHHGVPLAGILRALWLNLKSGKRVAGGSGITQQVIKLFRGRATGWFDKLKEARYALWLNANVDKNHTLATYLNHVSF